MTAAGEYPAPEVMRIGRARLTAGLDRFASIGLREHQEIFGSLRRMAAAQLIEIVESVNLRGRGGAAFPFGASSGRSRRRQRPAAASPLSW